MHSIAKTARIAGAVYLSTLPLAIYFWSYLPGKLIARGNATASAENILAHDTLFRFSILGDLFTHVILLCLAFLLYRLLFDVNRTWTFVMVGFVLVSTAVGFLNALNSLAAVILFRGADFLVGIDKPQREAMAMLFIRLHGQGFLINEVFSGLWLFPLGSARLPLGLPAAVPWSLADHRLFRLAGYQCDSPGLPGLLRHGVWLCSTCGAW